MSAPVPTGAADLREPPCVLGRGARFEGLLTFDGEARIAGHLVGEVLAEGTLYVDEGGAVEGPVSAHAVVVAGRVTGAVDASERVELLPGGELVGSVRTPRLVMAEGAHLDGDLTIGPDAARSG